MRFRRLIVASLMALATVGVTAGAAHAATPTYADKFARECAAKLAQGATIDDCQAAPSPLKPENSELVWGSISFAILLVLFIKFGYPAVTKAMKTREGRPYRGLRAGDLPDRRGGGLPHRHGGGALPLRAHVRDQRRAAQQALQPVDPGRGAPRRHRGPVRAPCAREHGRDRLVPRGH